MTKKSKGPGLGPELREKIAAQLPDAIDQAMRSYKNFYDQAMPGTAKDFLAHHSACKTGIAHIELLLKLAAWAKLPEKDDEDDALAGLLRDARAEVEKYNAEEEDEYE